MQLNRFVVAYTVEFESLSILWSIGSDCERVGPLSELRVKLQ
jgi:hypothetical protein